MGRMQYAPTRVHEKPARFHISPSGYAKNAPDFTLPNRDTPKTRPILDANLRRRTFQGVCNTPLHGYMQNLASFRPKSLARNIFGAYAIRPYTGTPKTRPILGANPCRKTFGGVCFCALHGYVQNLAGSIFPHTDTPKTHLISPFPIRIHPKPAGF